MPTTFKTFTSLEATDEFIRRMKAVLVVSDIHPDILNCYGDDGKPVAEVFHETETTWVAVIKEGTLCS